MLALRANVPVVPVGLCGTNAILPYGQSIPRPTLAHVGVHFGAPLSFADLQDLPSREQRSAALSRLETSLRQAVSRAREDNRVV